MKIKLSLITLFSIITLLLAACGSAPVAANQPAGQQPAASTQSSGQQPASGNTVEVKIAGFAFSPAELPVKVGTTVKWTNEDSAPHTVAGSGWGSDTLNKGQSFSYTFTSAGTFAYQCGVHPNMKATVTVTQ